MNFLDLVSFAKSGWTPADVREFLKASEEVQEEPETKEDNAESDHISKEIDENSAKTEEKPQEVETSSKDEVDYKALYEAEHEKVAKLQKANTKKNIEKENQNKSNDDIVKDLFKDFM